MCGICGICYEESVCTPDRDVLVSMRDALAHRGPDGSGLFVEPGVGLAHRRLSIIDVAGGAQPMFNEDRSVVLVFNGEIYNYVELRAELEGKGHRFATQSDSEVIVHLYEEKGLGFVDALNGMFGLAVWDTRARRLVLARDRLGEKPLYYHVGGGMLLFASELKALLKHPELPRGLCVGALDDYLSYGYVPGARCIVEGVNKLPAGEMLVWQAGRCERRTYWRIEMGEGAVGDERAWVEELEERLRESVRIRLRSDVPLGIFLSGGVDSSLVVALASEVSDRRVKTFSVGFDELEFDELRYARQVAARYETDHQELVVGDRNIDVLSELAYYLDEPMADPSAMPTFFLCREARRHVTVCLSGDGGDEVFAGYGRYREAVDYARIDRWAPRRVRTMLGRVSAALPSHVVGRGWLRRVSLGGADRYLAQCEKFTVQERARLLAPTGRAVDVSPWLFAPFFSDNGRRDIVTTLQHADQATYLPDDILVKVDRMSMRSALEVRVPLLDHTLVEFVNSVGPQWKLRGKVSKYALRAVAKKYLPPALMTRRKMGFGIPIKYWFRGNLESTARELLTSSDTRCTQWLDREAVRETIDAHLRGGRDFSRKIWALLVFEHWCRQMGF